MDTWPAWRHSGDMFNEDHSAWKQDAMHTAPESQDISAPTPARTPAARPADTRAWRVQVWVSFAAALALAGTGLAWLPGTELDRAFMLMGYGFSLSTAFVLAKFVRDNEQRRSDTPLWGAVVWGGFVLALVLTGWGLLRMEISPTFKAYLGVCWLYLISSVFTLAKTLRDAHEAALAQRTAGRDAA